MGASYTNSEESDYSANAARFSINHDFFGDLTNVGITYARGWNEVRRNGDDLFLEEAKSQSYRLDVSQIITKNFLVNMNYEGVTDEGFLNNPYRPGSLPGSQFSCAWLQLRARKSIPRTRTSSAFAAPRQVLPAVPGRRSKVSGVPTPTPGESKAGTRR